MRYVSILILMGISCEQTGVYGNSMPESPVSYEIHALLSRYLHLPERTGVPHNNPAVALWLRHYRCGYTCAERPIPIVIIDALTAWDISFIRALQRVLVGHHHARQATTDSLPILTTRYGYTLIAQLEEQLITYEQNPVTLTHELV